MTEFRHEMLLLHALDPEAQPHYSGWTDKWFVMGRIEFSDGSAVSGIAEHRETVEEAIKSFLLRLQVPPKNQLVRTSRYGVIRYHRWNGAAFAEVPEHLLPWR